MAEDNKGGGTFNQLKIGKEKNIIWIKYFLILSMIWLKLILLKLKIRIIIKEKTKK